MNFNNLLFNSITISLPKNMVQFSLGVILFWFLIGFPDLFTVIISLSGFLLAYSSVYLYNDFVDYEEDRNDREKIKWKIVAGGMLSAKHAKILTVIFAVTGLFLSYIVNRWFFLIILSMLLLNYLHSSPHIKFKKGIKKTAVNMTAIEFLKYSCGWFALTTDVAKFPFWMMITFAVVYMASYLIYKFKFKGSVIKSNKKMFFMIGVFGVFSYSLSFIQYGFPLSMTLLVIIPLSILLFLKQIEIEFHKISNMLIIEYLLIPLLIISFVVLMVPIVGQANEKMVSTIGTYKESVIKEIPSDIKNSMENFSEELEKYQSIEDIESKITNNTKNIFGMNGS